MTGVALAAVGADRAGVGAAVLNAARQAGAAVGVALLGSVAFAHAGHGGPASSPHLLRPMVLAAIGYLIALIVSMVAIGRPGLAAERPGA